MDITTQNLMMAAGGQKGFNIDKLELTQYAKISPWPLCTFEQGGLIDVHFTSNGTSMFTYGITGDNIMKYNLTTAFDVSTASLLTNTSLGFAMYSGILLSSGVVTEGRSIYFKNDGTKVYALDNTGDSVRQYSLSTAWDVYTIQDDMVAFSVGTQDANPFCLRFSSNGGIMYVLGNVNDTVYQYTLSTAWDISTASYASKSKSVNAQDTNPLSIYFKTDGTKMYMIGSINDTVYQYTLNPAWDVSTATYDNKSKLLAEDAAPYGLWINDAGTKLFMCGSTNGFVYQYTMSTAWDISTATYDSKSVRAKSMVRSGFSIQLSSDGTKAYVVDATNDSLTQYELGTAWDISTITDASRTSPKYFSLTTIDTGPRHVFFKTDGAKFFFTGITSDRVYECSMSTPWDISTASYVNTHFVSVSAQTTQPEGLFFTSNGTVMFVASVAPTAGAIYKYTLSTAWQVNTATYNSQTFTSAEIGSAIGLSFSNTGTVLYVVGNSADGITQYDLTSAWNVATANVASRETYYLGSLALKAYQGNNRQLTLINGRSAAPGSVTFTSNGSVVYCIDDSGDFLIQMDLTTPWDVMTVVEDDRKYFNYKPSMPANTYVPTSMFIDANTGTRMFLLTDASEDVFQYTLSTPWDVSTATYDSKTFDITVYELSPTGLFFKSDGTSMYTIGQSSVANTTLGVLVGEDRVHQFTLSTPWNVSTATHSGKTFNVVQDTAPHKIVFDPSGTRAYIIGNQNDSVYEYSLSTAWDVSTMTYTSRSFSVASQDADVRGLYITENGSNMFFSGRSALANTTAAEGLGILAGEEAVYQYKMSTPWDISTSSFEKLTLGRRFGTGPTDLMFNPKGTWMYYLNGSTVTPYIVQVPIYT